MVPTPGTQTYAVQVTAGTTNIGIEGASFSNVQYFDVLANGWQIYGGGVGLYLLGPCTLSGVTVSAPGYDSKILSSANISFVHNQVQVYTTDSAGNYVWVPINGYYVVSLTVAPVVVTPQPTTIVDVNVISAYLQNDPNQPTDNQLQLVLIYNFVPQSASAPPIPWSVQKQIPVSINYGDTTYDWLPNGTPDGNYQRFIQIHDYQAAWAEKNSPIGTNATTGCIDVESNPISVYISPYGDGFFGMPSGYSSFLSNNTISVNAVRLLPLDNNQLAAITAAAACSVTSQSGW